MKEKKREELQRKLNILQVHNFYRQRGGEDAVVEKEAELLRQHGHRVFRYFKSNKDMECLPVLQKLCLPMTSVFSIGTYQRVRNMIREQDIDLVHVHNTLHLISPSVIRAAKKEHVPVVMTVHNFRLCCPNGLFYRGGHACEDCMKKGLLCAIRHRCYRNSYLQTMVMAGNLWLHRRLHTYRGVHFICFTEFQKQKICNLADVDRKNVWIKPNVCEAYEEDGNAADTGWGKQILYVGRLSKEKGIRDLIKAYELLALRLKKEQREVPALVVCGDGPLLETARQYVRKQKLSGVVFTGQVPEQRVVKEMQKSGCVVLPSRCYEGMPMVLVKAYHMKKPVIVPDFGCFHFLVENGVNGFLYTPYDIQNLQEVLHDFLTQEEKESCSFATSGLMEDTTCEKNYDRLLQIYLHAMDTL